MQRKKHTQQEIEAKLKHADKLAAQGKLHKDIARTLGVSIMTFHRWRKMRPTQRHSDSGKLTRSIVRRSEQSLDALERENARLRLLVTDLLLEKARLEEALVPEAGRFRRMLSARASKG